jgi:uncharacterized alpha-E superfamily protein
MLLSRVADALYWISRYLERAEHTARLIDVAVDHGLGRATATDGSAIERLYQSIGLDQPGHPASLAGMALFDVTNRSSVAACITTARENARQVREEISSPMWQQLNELYLRVKQMREEGSWSARTHYAANSVIEGVHLFQGITDSTMGHGEGWQYLQVGRYLERADATSALLDLFVAESEDPNEPPAARDQVEWVALLRSCSALEAYCRHYTADVRSERVAEFLLLNEEFPRSVRFAAVQLEGALRSLAAYSGRSAGGRAERLSGRLRASLEYGQVDEILNDGPRAYLSSISRQCGQIHSALQQSYVSYPVETALPA